MPIVEVAVPAGGLPRTFHDRKSVALCLDAPSLMASGPASLVASGEGPSGRKRKIWPHSTRRIAGSLRRQTGACTTPTQHLQGRCKARRPGRVQAAVLDRPDHLHDVVGEEAGDRTENRSPSYGAARRCIPALPPLLLSALQPAVRAEGYEPPRTDAPSAWACCVQDSPHVPWKRRREDVKMGRAAPRRRQALGHESVRQSAALPS